MPTAVPAILRTALLALLLSGSGALAAPERIEDFSVRMTLNDEGYLTVAEAITVNVRGDQVKRYLYRSLAEELQLPNGDSRDVAYTANRVRVERIDEDGSRSTVFRRQGSKELLLRQFAPPRLRAGDPGTELEPGQYTFHFNYRVTAPFRASDDSALLYWPVTGRGGWALDTRRLRVVLELPPAIPARRVDITTYNRESGEGERIFRTDLPQIRRSGDGAITVITNRGVPAGGEFALSARWPSGLVEPSRIPLDFEAIGMTIVGAFVLLAFAAFAFYLVFFVLPPGRGGGAGPGAGGGAGGGGAGGGGGGGGG